MSMDGSLGTPLQDRGDVLKGMIDYGQAAAFVKGIDRVESVFDDIIDDARLSLERLGNAAGTTVSRESLCAAS